MKNIANSGILARIRKLAPQSSERAAPFRTPEEWREWQLAEGRRSCEEIDRQNRQARAEKIFGRAGIQRLHRGCSFANYRIQNDGQRHALSQAKSIAGELDTGCTNFVFSGNPGNRFLKTPEGVVSSYDRTRNVICTECRNSVTMQRVLAFYRGHHREAKSA